MGHTSTAVNANADANANANANAVFKWFKKKAALNIFKPEYDTHHGGLFNQC